MTPVRRSLRTSGQAQRGAEHKEGLAAVLVLLSVSDVGHRASRALLTLDEPGSGEHIKCHLGLAG